MTGSETWLVTGLVKVYWVTGSETWLVTGQANIYWANGLETYPNHLRLHTTQQKAMSNLRTYTITFKWSTVPLCHFT